MPYLKPEILARCQKSVSGYDDALLHRAYDFTKKNLKPEEYKRLGTAIETVRILLGLYPDMPMLVATLLHSLPDEKTPSESEIRREFGEETLVLLANLKKLYSIPINNEAEQFELLRLMLIAIAEDLRVVVIMLAERLYRLHHLETSTLEKKQALARETLAIYAPIASRLGIFYLKGQLEDLAFSYLYPEECEEIKGQMVRLEAYRERIIVNSGKRLRLLLKQNGIAGRVIGRTKNLYSIYRKLQMRGERDIEAVHDIFAMRVIVASVAECYAVLGILHEHFLPLSNRFKDYIAAPKPNGYQSLHTTVVGIAGIMRKSFPVEIQIRTEGMDLHAEYGFAAHWHYKEKGSTRRAASPNVSELPVHASRQESVLGEKIVMSGEATKKLIHDRIFTLTPHGNIINLPAGATPIDFAFAIHSDLGLSLRVAKVNGKPVAVSEKLKNGDIVEIIGSKNPQPNQEWLKIAVTKKAKSKLRAFLRDHDSVALLREGKKLLNSHLVDAGLPPLDQNLSLLRDYAGKRRVKREREDLIIKLAQGTLSPGKVMREITEPLALLVAPSPKEKTEQPIAIESPALVIGGWPNVPFRMADCCKPKAGDRIIGFVTRGTHVTIHRTDCRTLFALDPRRFIEAYYERDGTRYEVRLNIFQRSGFTPRLNDVTEHLTRIGVPIKNLFLRSGLREKPGIILEAEIKDSEELLSVITALEDISWVKSVKLVQEL